MYMKGMEAKIYYISILIEYLLISLIISLICIAFSKLFLFTNSNCLLIFLLYFFHCMNQFSYSFCFALIFNSFISNIIFENSIYFMTAMLGIMFNTYDFSFSSLFVSSFIPPIGGISFISILTDLEVY